MELTRVYTLSDLEAAVALKRAVFAPGSVGRVPAAFVINFPGSILLRLFRSGLFLYPQKPLKTKQAK